MDSEHENQGDARLGALFGTGRSGTTWLGAILSSHPDIAYRFEPFSRARAMTGEARFLRKLADQAAAGTRIGASVVGEIYRILVVAHPEWEKPPFFPKRFATRWTGGRSLLWPLARRFGPASTLFCHLYTPKESPTVVFKQVASEPLFAFLVAQTDVPIVYLLRHPCATICSTVAGQQRGLMGTGRRDVVEAYVQDHAPDLWKRFGDRVATMSLHEKEALLWRTNVEKCLGSVPTSRPDPVVFYEELCRRPEVTAARVLARFGLGMHSQVENFIRVSTGDRKRGPRLLRELGVNRYFSVYKNPTETADAWKSRLDPDQRRQILDIVRDSEPFLRGKEKAGWEE